MAKIEIIADSITRRGHRLTTFSCEYWRAILAEVNTHRMLSRNSPSSRAIPVHKMMKKILEEPAMPVRWSKNEPGMQGHETLEPYIIDDCRALWLEARDSAMDYAARLSELGLHKQIANRILEPWMCTKSLISATDWENFFHLRVHKDAQDDFQELAHTMLRAYLQNNPKLVEFGDWHLPYADRLSQDLPIEERVKIVTGRGCRVSYYNQDGMIDPAKDCELHDKITANGHWSPTEHAAKAVDTDDYFGNFQGWEQYRKTFANENRHGNLHELLASYETEKGIARQCGRCKERIATVGAYCVRCAYDTGVLV